MERLSEPRSASSAAARYVGQTARPTGENQVRIGAGAGGEDTNDAGDALRTPPLTLSHHSSRARDRWLYFLRPLRSVD